MYPAVRSVSILCIADEVWVSFSFSDLLCTQYCVVIVDRGRNGRKEGPARDMEEKAQTPDTRRDGRDRTRPHTTTSDKMGQGAYAGALAPGARRCLCESQFMQSAAKQGGNIHIPTIRAALWLGTVL
jgi:hypothetical protein